MYMTIIANDQKNRPQAWIIEEHVHNSYRVRHDFVITHISESHTYVQDNQLYCTDNVYLPFNCMLPVSEDELTYLLS
jgi:hypothetical protein